uniref:Uncharacterized protein n=1 Tax=Brassica oleracea TaxID=3712 RepID=A0A3P6GD42_BRAOL|nr:unnamed protein product [Brassica oleracea]
MRISFSCLVTVLKGTFVFLLMSLLRWDLYMMFYTGGKVCKERSQVQLLIGSNG